MSAGKIGGGGSRGSRSSNSSSTSIRDDHIVIGNLNLKVTLVEINLISDRLSHSDSSSD